MLKQLRVLLPLLIGLFALLLIASTYLSNRFQTLQVLEVTLERQLRDRLNLVQGIGEQLLAIDRERDLQRLLSAQATESDLKLALITNPAGRVVAANLYTSNGRYWYELAAGADRLAADQALTERTSRLRRSDDGRWLDGYASLCRSEPGALRPNACGLIFYRLDLMHHRDRALHGITSQALINAAGVSLGAILFWILFHWLFTRRTSQLIAVVNAVSRGDRQVRSHITGVDELASFGHALNTMLDRIGADEQLLQRQSRAIEESPAMIIITNIDYRIEYVNPAFSRITGYAARDVQGLHFAAIGSSDGKPALCYHDVLKRLRQGESWRGELPERKRNGEPVWLSATILPLRSDEGEIINYVAIEEDITQQRQLQEALRRKQQSLAKAQSMAHVGNWDWDIASDQISWTDEIYRILGLRPGEERPTFNSFLERVHPEDQPRVRGAIMRALAEPTQPYHMEHRILQPNGSERIVLEVGDIERDEQGQPVFMIGTMQDITERKRAEQELKRHRDNLQQLVDDQTASINAIVQTAADGIITIDSDGLILSFNRAAEMMFGYRANEVLGLGVRLLMPLSHHAMLPDRLSPVDDLTLDRMLDQRHEVMAVRRDGSEFPISLAINRMDVAGEQRFTLLVRDITQEKEAEAELIQARTAAEQASRAKMSFLANMSHEIRTPMNAIIGMTDLVLDTELRPQQEKRLRAVASSARSLLSLLNDILDLSKLEGGKLTLEAIPFNLRQLLASIEEMLQISAEKKGLLLEMSVDEEVPHCLRGDPTRLRQVLLNLIGNAIKFTEQGEINVHVAVDPQQPASYCYFSIRDTGIGIAPERIGQVFERFSQADESTTRRFGGTGLGTTISRELVELMEGRIWVESELGRGSHFQFTARLQPLMESECRMLDAPISRDTQHHVQPLTILLAEDIPLNQELVTVRLEEHGHQVVVADNGVVALDLFQQQRFDLVLMDVMMPEMDGLEATRRIRDLERRSSIRTPIIMLTAGVMPADQRRCFDAGADDFVGKPIDFPLLYQAIARFFEGEAAIEGRVGELTGGPTPPSESRASATEQAPSNPPAAALALPEITGLDCAAGLRIWGQQAIYQRGLFGFARDYRSSIEQLREHLAAGRSEDAVRLMHTLKGISGNLGMPQLSESSGVMEQQLRQQQVPEDTQLAALEQQLFTLIDGITQWQQSLAAATTTADATAAASTAGAPPFAWQQLAEPLQRLQQALQQSEIDEEILDQLRSQVPVTAFERLEGFLDDFEFDRAIALVERWLSS